MSREPRSPVWVKSRKCESVDCVEVADIGSEILIRNSRDPGHVVRILRGDWKTFAAGIASGSLNRV